MGQKKLHLLVRVVPSTHFHVPSSSVSVSPIQMLVWNFPKKPLLQKQKWIIMVKIGNGNKFTGIILFPVFADNSEPGKTHCEVL